MSQQAFGLGFRSIEIMNSPDLEGAVSEVCGKDRHQQMHLQRCCVLTMRTDPMGRPR